MRRPFLACALLAGLAACGRDEPTVAERFNELTADVENQAQAIEAEANNSVTAEQLRLDAEADALRRQSENAMQDNSLSQLNAQ